MMATSRRFSLEVALLLSSLCCTAAASNSLSVKDSNGDSRSHQLVVSNTKERRLRDQNYDPMFSRVAPVRDDKEVYRITEERLRLIREPLMYPYFDGGEHAELDPSNIPQNDYQEHINVGATMLNKQLNFRFPFFGMAYNYTWISINGYVGFSDNPIYVAAYPLQFPQPEWPRIHDPSFIGPFYSEISVGALRGDEIDKRKPGVYFRVERDLNSRTDQFGVELRERLKWDIREGIVGSSVFRPQHCFIVTWKNVSFVGGQKPYSLLKTNTFQLVIATDEITSYAIFNYEYLGWTAHTGAGGDPVEGLGGTPAFVGFNAGNGTKAFEYVPYSQQMKIRDLPNAGNTNDKAGRHIFRIDERILRGTCNPYPEGTNLPLVFAPEKGNMLGGQMVNFTGVCLLPKDRVVCRFDSWTVEGIVLGPNKGMCITPLMTTSGYVVFAISINGGPFHWRGYYFVETPDTAPEGVWFENHDWQLPHVDVLSIKWDARNLSLNAQHMVQISLWGYKETQIDPQFLYIDELVESTPNTGSYDLTLADYKHRRNHNLTELKLGMIMVNLTDSASSIGLKYSPKVWSRPVPLAWYFKDQWQAQYGSKWSHQLCFDWVWKDKRMKQFAHDVPRCPCLLQQALAAKGHFVADYSCDINGNTECLYHKGAVHCVRSGLPNRDGASQQCCYDREGYLMMTADKKWGGTPQRAHNLGMLPYFEANKVPTMSHWYHDIIPFYLCCMWNKEQSDSCEMYRFEMRVSQDCVGYQPPTAAAVYGDPHITTFDNVEYTFNGRGEFVLVRANTANHKLDVQGRFEAVENNLSGFSLGTTLKAVAAKDNQSSTVEVKMRSPESQWRYKLDITVDSIPIYFDSFSTKIQQFKGVTVYTPSNILNQSIIVIMFQSGAGVEVVESRGYMSCRVYLPLVFMNKTRGLFGNWSGNKEDDFQRPDDPNDSYEYLDPNNFQLVHERFGMKWAVEDKDDPLKGKSLFFHTNERSSNFYYDEAYKPLFEKMPTLPDNITLKNQDVLKFCGMSYQCYFDYAVTYNRELARWTKHFQDEFVNIKQIGLQKVISCGALATPKHGRKSSVFYTPGSVVKFDCDAGYILIGDRERKCEYDGQWNDPEAGKARCLPEESYSAMMAGITSGIVIAVVIPLLCIAVLILVCIKKNRRRKNAAPLKNGSLIPKSGNHDSGKGSSEESPGKSKSYEPRDLDGEYFTGEPLPNRYNYEFDDENEKYPPVTTGHSAMV